MVVKEVHPPESKYRYGCVWMDGYRNPHHETFRASDLTPDETPQ